MNQDLDDTSLLHHLPLYHRDSDKICGCRFRCTLGRRDCLALALLVRRYRVDRRCGCRGGLLYSRGLGNRCILGSFRSGGGWCEGCFLGFVGSEERIVVSVCLGGTSFFGVIGGRRGNKDAELP